MSKFTGDDQQHENQVIEVDFFPSIATLLFTQRFANLKELTPELILSALTDAADKVAQQLESVTNKYSNYAAFVSDSDLSESKLTRLYWRAVHFFALCDILSNNITISDTANNKDRADNLQQRIDNAEREARHSISLFLSQATIYSEVC